MRWNRLASSASRPRWNSCTCACVHASVTARSNAAGVRCLSARSSARLREAATRVQNATCAVAPWRQPHPASKAEDRIEHCPARVGQRATIDHRDRCTDTVPAAQKARPVRFELRAADGLAFDDREVRRPHRRVGRRSEAARRQNRADVVHELRLHEQVREDRVRGVGRGGRQHDLRIRRHIDFASPASVIEDRDAADLGVVLRRDRDFERRRDRAVAPDDFDAILEERRLVTIRFDAARLVPRRPHLAAVGIAKEDVRAPAIARRVLAPARDGEIAPAAVARPAAVIITA